jgi:hypothetical protein
MDADGNGEKSTTTFRWINVARYALTSVVTVLIAAVVVIAIKMVVRPDSLKVRVVGGFISVETPPGLPPNHLLLQFKVKADNPSGRAVMYYYNISGYLFDKNISASTSNPQGDCFVSIQIKNKTLQQQQAVYSYTWSTVGPEIMTPSYFYMLYHNRSARIDDVTMRIQGNLRVQQDRSPDHLLLQPARRRLGADHHQRRPRRRRGQQERAGQRALRGGA